MALYTGVIVEFIKGEAQEGTMEADVVAYIETLDSTTNPVITIVPYRGGLLVVSGA